MPPEDTPIFSICCAAGWLVQDNGAFRLRPFDPETDLVIDKRGCHAFRSRRGSLVPCERAILRELANHEYYRQPNFSNLWASPANGCRATWLDWRNWAS